MINNDDDEGDNEASPTVQLDERSDRENSEDAGTGSSIRLDDVRQPREASIGVDNTPLDDLDCQFLYVLKATDGRGRDDTLKSFPIDSA